METTAPTLGKQLPRPAQYRVIDGTLYVRETLPFQYDITVHDLGHGHVEAAVMPRYGWSESDQLSPSALADYTASQGSVWDSVRGAWVPYVPTALELLDKAAMNRSRSSRRARTKVRRLCKAKALTTMVTLTYRDNVTDRARMARDFDVFVKRVRRVVPDFQYVCVFEKQKRGAWHAHIAVPRVLSHYLHKGALVRSYDLLRSLWRGVVGVDGGNVDVSRQKRLKRSVARLASYLSKYITKGFEDAVDAGDSYRASGRALPKPMRFQSLSSSLFDGLMSLHDLLAKEVSTTGEFHNALLDCGGYYLVLSP